MGRRQVSATRPARVSPRFDASWGRDALVVTVAPAGTGGIPENEIRKDFTASERVAIAKAVEEEIGNRQGQRTDRAEPLQNFAEVGKRTEDIAAEVANVFKMDERSVAPARAGGIR